MTGTNAIATMAQPGVFMVPPSKPLPKGRGGTPGRKQKARHLSAAGSGRSPAEARARAHIVRASPTWSIGPSP